MLKLEPDANDRPCETWPRKYHIMDKVIINTVAVKNIRLLGAVDYAGFFQVFQVHVKHFTD